MEIFRRVKKLNPEKWLDLLYKVRSNQAKFQPQALCKILRVGKISKTEMADYLKSVNPEIVKENPTYNWKSCPVFKVLTNKKMIVMDKNQIITINTTLNNTQKKEALDFCKGSM